MLDRLNPQIRSVIGKIRDYADQDFQGQAEGVGNFEAMKVAKNITKPIVVNNLNKKFLLKLVQNGPDVYPGAKILEKKNGDNISLRYVDRNSINLQNGDKVHRHMMDGDAVLFNRQPTLHRMSMMCHIAKILPKGDTFRMNVGCTKPYNADFDGDEMNVHAPQSIQTQTELAMIGDIRKQIISPKDPIFLPS